MNKKKLAVFHPALAPYRIDFFNALVTYFNTKLYFTYINVQDQKFDQGYLRKQSNFDPLYLERGFSIAGRTFRFGIISLLQKENPNIVICSEFGQITLVSFLYYLLSGRKFKLYTICDDSITNALERKGLRALFRNIISKNIDGVIYASSEVGKWNVQHVSKRINPLELPIIHKDETFRNKLKDSLPIAAKYIKDYALTEKKIVLFVGRLVKVKNISFLLNAFSKIDAKETVLVIVGSGPLEEQLKQNAKSKNIEAKVLFTGRLERNELHAWFALAHLFVLPSTYEPFGAVINEALLAGCKILCSNKAGAVTLVNQQNGDSFDPYNEKELTEKLNKALKPIGVLQNTELIIRKNNMPFTFNEKIEKLIYNL
ncbi:glycosyltransferase [Mariniphaga sp.]|uniref:glycosyltransferase n=1 Tax=Mariniphaga sp. TaxID=1954475 RepID=UPI0035617B2D